MRGVLGGLLAAIVWLSASFAQDANTIDLTAFENAANRIELALEQGRVGDETLAGLRTELDDWRDRLSDLQGVNETEIATLEGQLSALGPEPAEGETEPRDVAERREELQSDLAEARAPQLRADAAFAKANVLIGQIDAELRQRQTDAFFELQTSPLNPAIWSEAMSAFRETLRKLSSEVRRNLSTAGEQRVLRERAPLVLGLLLVAFLLIIRGPRWIERLQKRITARAHPLGASVWGFLVSLGEILLPVIGLTLLISAVRLTGLLGSLGNLVAIAINVAIFVLAVGRWLARRLFPDDPRVTAPFKLTDGQSKEGRWLVRALASLFALSVLINGLGEIDSDSEIFVPVLMFPVFVLIAVALFRLGRLFTSAVANVNDESDESAGFSLRLGGLLGRAIRVIAVVGVGAAAIGYFNMATGLLGPTVLTLALIGTIVALHVFVRSAWGLMRGLNEEELDQALVPIVITFVLAVLSIPLATLFWGARTTDLAEIWTQFLNGFQVGESRLRPGDFLTFLLVFAIGFGVTRLIQGALKTSVLPRTRLDKGAQSAAVSGLGYVGLTIAALIAITAAGINLSSLAIVVGALGVGIGFGLQNIVNNFVSGIIMLIERPVSEGDIVEVGGSLGTVKSISVRSTRIETFDRQDVIVPNGDFISGTVTNWTRGNSYTRVTVNVGVAYSSDSRRVHEILTEICEAHPLVATDPPPVILFSAFGADALDFTCYCILRDVAFKLPTLSDLNHAIHERFREEGIEIPFAQRDVWLRNPETLRGNDPQQKRSEPQSRGPARITRESAAAPLSEAYDDGTEADGSGGDAR